jgi:hypothetical protein
MRLHEVTLDCGGDVLAGHYHRHERRKQCFRGKAGQAPDCRRRYAAMRGEIAGALVCGSISNAIKR